MGCFFITGTDTNVGKTIASRAIIQALQKQHVQIVGYKPIACSESESFYGESQSEQVNDYGSADNRDVQILIESANHKLNYQEANSYTLSQPLEPNILLAKTIKVDIEKLNFDLNRLKMRYQCVLVEGTFGWLTPITEHKTFADWVRMQNMPAVLVVGIKEGCINHALLTMQSIIQMGVPLLGWVANRVNPCLGYYAEIIETLTQKIDAPLLGEIPYVHHPETQDLSRYITNTTRLSYMNTVLS
ncbi:dethiobiotin synthase [Conservatibacter flavescens]|uniref:ATP-dependent dethiobiotin synthetase BioD n=1 Tax=Conservatibacter flavescens TaxID=28161 RepID=A0A2M8S601_9PAST|nr:dethiobiotin synthase [Conservatibacter flavescens]PJG86541.1 dethiobiotin synthase [Conservatibacter flavescens]